jgi:indole-3-glycerol phosphate synthase
MNDRLERILEDKRAEIATLNPTMIRSVRPSTRDLAYAVGWGRETLSLLVEVKRHDPFEGDVRLDLDVIAFGASLQEMGIGALVVATESRHWDGSRNDLVALDRTVQMPLVRHDFIIEEMQLFESRRAGADAVFLRPALLAPDLLRGFARTLAAMHMSAVLLVHDQAELEAALSVESQFIAISNRHPETGAIDLAVTESLAPRVPKSRSVISCFGIRTAADVARLRGLVDAVCLGTPLLRATDPAAFLRSLTGG